MSGLLARLALPFENPVMRREMRQVTRRGRFEWVMLVLTVGMTLVIASVGGRVNAGAHPAEIGKLLYQTFFTIAHGLVLIAGPGVAASSIAAEREGRTYEALALTGISPSRVALGKFMAAFANVGSYVVALAPVGALPFLFGGVSALSVLYAFGMLFVFTALASLFGLAISARVPTTRAALITSVLAGAASAFLLYTVFGDTIGTSVCEAVGAQRPGTIWLPVILAEANLSAQQTIALIATPLVLAVLVGWFMFEVCTANLSDSSADRTTGLKRWYAISAVLGALVASAATFVVSTRSDRASFSITAIAAYTLFVLFGAFVFQGDAITAPRRVRLQWKARSAGLLQRFFGPGVTSSAAMQLGAAAVCIGTIATVGLLLSLAEEYGPSTAPLGVVALALPAAMFVLFTVGLAMWLRVRFGTNIGRAVLAVTMVVIFVAPYAVTAILGGDSTSTDSIVPLLAAPSPAFALEVARRVAQDQTDAHAVMAVLGCAATYAVLGLVTLSAGAVRADRLVASLDADAARMDGLIAREDAEAAAKPSSVVSAEPAEGSKATSEAGAKS